MTTTASRRAFLQRAGALSMTGVAAPWALNLAAIGEAAAASATDYKALVCVFLHGGNDWANTIVPYDPDSHAAYAGMRPTLAHTRAKLAATALVPSVPLPGGRQFALAPGLAGLLPLFNAGQLGVLMNVGPLVGPTTKTQYLNQSVLLPPKLFSHADQTAVWQSSSPEGAASGWGGRLGDLFQAANGNATFTCVNATSNAVFMSGQQAAQYQVSSGGSIAIQGLAAPLFGSAACSAALQKLIQAPSTHLIRNELARVTRRSIDANVLLRTTLAGAPPLKTEFPEGNVLSPQLQLVARMLSVAGALGAKRQVFFVGIGGFDNHFGLEAAHPALLTKVAGALTAFHAATVELGIASKVTTFTASDFGRTITAIEGSDHGWGSMHLMLGGAVRGQRLYGVAPVIANNGPDDIGEGRLLPTTSVDQYGATLGAWFGASSTDLLTVMPNLANHAASERNLGFV